MEWSKRREAYSIRLKPKFNEKNMYLYIAATTADPAGPDLRHGCNWVFVVVGSFYGGFFPSV